MVKIKKLGSHTVWQIAHSEVMKFVQHKAAKMVRPWVFLCHNSPVSQPTQLEVSATTTHSSAIFCHDEKLIIYYNGKLSLSGELP